MKITWKNEFFEKPEFTLKLKDINPRVKKFAFYGYQVFVILGSLFYFFAKRIAGHGSIWHWDEIACFVLGLTSIVFGYMARSDDKNRLVQIIAIALYFVAFILTSIMSFYLITFQYDDDESPLAFYILTLFFTLSAGVNCYAMVLRTYRGI